MANLIDNILPTAKLYPIKIKLSGNIKIDEEILWFYDGEQIYCKNKEEYNRIIKMKEFL